MSAAVASLANGSSPPVRGTRRRVDANLPTLAVLINSLNNRTLAKPRGLDLLDRAAEVAAVPYRMPLYFKRYVGRFYRHSSHAGAGCQDAACKYLFRRTEHAAELMAGIEPIAVPVESALPRP